MFEDWDGIWNYLDWNYSQLMFPFLSGCPSYSALVGMQMMGEKDWKFMGNIFGIFFSTASCSWADWLKIAPTVQETIINCFLHLCSTSWLRFAKNYAKLSKSHNFEYYFLSAVLFFSVYLINRAEVLLLFPAAGSPRDLSSCLVLCATVLVYPACGACELTVLGC